MSKPIQSVNDIGPMAVNTSSTADAQDPAKIDYDQGKRFLDNGNLTQAAVSLHNALLGYEEKGDKTGMANASNQLGHVCLAKGDYYGAENHYMRCMELCKEFGDPMSMFSLSKRLVEAYRGQKNYDEAVKYCFEILDTYQRNNDPRGTVELLEKLADIYIEADQALKAADTYRTIASIHKNFKHASIADSFEQKARQLEANA